MEDLDGQILPPFAKYLLDLLAHYLPGPMMRIDDAVANRELDRLYRVDRPQFFRVLFD
jgi:hypothetical protein